MVVGGIDLTQFERCRRKHGRYHAIQVDSGTCSPAKYGRHVAFTHAFSSRSTREHFLSPNAIEQNATSHIGLFFEFAFRNNRLDAQGGQQRLGDVAFGCSVQVTRQIGVLSLRWKLDVRKCLQTSLKGELASKMNLGDRSPPISGAANRSSTRSTGIGMAGCRAFGSACRTPGPVTMPTSQRLLNQRDRQVPIPPTSSFMESSRSFET